MFPGGRTGALMSSQGLLPLDWNRDFKMDLAVAGRSGLRLLAQSDTGTFTDTTADSLNGGGNFGVWTADLEMDGDLDLILGSSGGPPIVLRNNGDGSWRQLQPFAGIVGLRGFVWGDLDGDGDPDAALLDAAGGVHVFENRQAGQFREMPAPAGLGTVIALTLGDVNADGLLDLVTLGADGSIRRVSRAATAGNNSRWPPGPIDLRAARRERIGCFWRTSTTTARSISWRRAADARACGSPMPRANFSRSRRFPTPTCPAWSISMATACSIWSASRVEIRSG